MNMKNLKQNKGQTLIETAFVLIILVLIALGITEFARAWYTKNSLKNAARQGARAAVVTSGITDEIERVKTSTPDPASCGSLTGNDRVYCYIWISPGIKNGAKATIEITDTSANGIKPDADDTVRVIVSDYFDFIVGGSSSSIWWWSDQTFTADATMRYE
jgi:Flp pilus assembly protein TadG